MIEAIWEEFGDDEAALVPQLQRYFVACCRRIWRLLPQDDSRSGVEVAERYLSGEVTDEELKEADYNAEGAYFNILYNCDPEAIDRWAGEVKAIPPDDMAAMLHPPGVALDMDARELLARAAGFVDGALIFPLLINKRIKWDGLTVFMPADLLRAHFEDLLREQDGQL